MAIKNELEYEKVVKEMETLLDIYYREKDDSLLEELEKLSDLVMLYDETHYPVGKQNVQRGYC